MTTLFLASQLVDLLYRLDSRCENRDELRVGGIPPYPHQLPAALDIPVQQQIEAVPVGVVPGFALVGPPGEKGGDDVWERRNDPHIHPAIGDPAHVLPVIDQQALSFD